MPTRARDTSLWTVIFSAHRASSIFDQCLLLQCLDYGVHDKAVGSILMLSNRGKFGIITLLESRLQIQLNRYLSRDVKQLKWSLKNNKNEFSDRFCQSVRVKELSVLLSLGSRSMKIQRRWPYFKPRVHRLFNSYYLHRNWQSLQCKAIKSGEKESFLYSFLEEAILLLF